MENASLPDVIWNNVTTSSSVSQEPQRYVDNVRDLVVKVVYFVMGTVGVLDNLFVIIVFALFVKITEKTMNILIVQQSITDLCASFFLLLTGGIKAKGTGMSRDSSLDQFVCRIWITKEPLWMMLVTSTYGIVLTAFDRYVAVVYPIWYNQKMCRRNIVQIKIKKRLVSGAIATIWIVMPAYMVVISVISSDIIGGNCLPWVALNSKDTEKAFSIQMLVITYLLPLVLMILCYSRIAYAIRTKVATQGSSAGYAASRNAVVTSLMICCGYVVCWTPNQISFIRYLTGVGDLQGWFHQVSVFLVFANSCINPFIYAAKYREFQQGVKRLVSKVKNESNQVATSNL